MLNAKVSSDAGALAVTALLMPGLPNFGLMHQIPDAVVTRSVDAYGQDARGWLLRLGCRAG